LVEWVNYLSSINERSQKQQQRATMATAASLAAKRNDLGLALPIKVTYLQTINSIVIESSSSVVFIPIVLAIAHTLI
jgi:hypothetical protein